MDELYILGAYPRSGSNFLLCLLGHSINLRDHHAAKGLDPKSNIIDIDHYYGAEGDLVRARLERFFDGKRCVIVKTHLLPGALAERFPWLVDRATGSMTIVRDPIQVMMSVLLHRRRAGSSSSMEAGDAGFLKSLAADEAFHAEVEAYLDQGGWPSWIDTCGDWGSNVAKWSRRSPLGVSHRVIDYASLSRSPAEVLLGLVRDLGWSLDAAAIAQAVEGSGPEQVAEWYGGQGRQFRHDGGAEVVLTEAETCRALQVFAPELAHPMTRSLPQGWRRADGPDGNRGAGADGREDDVTHASFPSAQNFEDVILGRLFPDRDEGFYVDVGACDPHRYSVTNTFYQRGWRGVNVEPHPLMLEKLRLFRPRDINLSVGVGGRDSSLTFFECTNYPEMSTFNPNVAARLVHGSQDIRRYSVPVTTLNQIFESYCPRRVDFLKIDVEGLEGEILLAFDLARFRPTVLVVESTRPNADTAPWEASQDDAIWGAWEPAVLGAGYVFALFDGLNRFYVREDEAGLVQRLSFPPGVFDPAIRALNDLAPVYKEAAEARLQVIATLESHAASLDALRAGKEQEASALAEQVRVFAQAAEERLRVIEALQRHVDEVSAKHAAEEKRAAALAEQVGVFSKAADDRLAVIVSYSETIAELRERNDSLKDLLIEAQAARAAAVDAALRSVERHAAVEDERRTVLDAQLASLALAQEREAGAQAALAEATREVQAALDLRKAEQEREIARLQEALGAMDAQARAVAEQLSLAEAQAAFLAAQNLGLRHDVAAAETQAEALQAEKAGAERDLVALRHRVREAEEHYGYLRDESERRLSEAERLRREAEYGHLAEHRRLEAALAVTRARAEALERAETERLFLSWRAKLNRWAQGRGKAFALSLAYQAPHPPPPSKNPKITVVTPVFNGAATILDAVRSVVTQSYPNVEYIIVDGGSTDETLDLIRMYGHAYQLICEPDNGMYDAIGKGFARATGDILCYLNADDTFESEALSRVAEQFGDLSREQVIYYEDNVLVEGWKFPNIAQPHVDYISLLFGHVISQDGVFFTRRAYDLVGGINRNLRLAGDWDLWVRLAYRFRFKRARGHVSTFQVRDGQLSGDARAYAAEQQAERERRLAEIPRLEWWFRRGEHAINKLWGALERVFSTSERRLFFPFDFPEMPAQRGAKAPPVTPVTARSPISPNAPTELLFSKTNPRLGAPAVDWVYYDRRVDWVCLHPPLDPARRMERRSGALAPAAAVQPPANDLRNSPYRNWRARRRDGRSRLRPPGFLARFAGPADAQSARVAVIMTAVRRSRLGPGRILDVGCASGDLLDAFQRLGWETHGVEDAKDRALEAHARGHRIHVHDTLDLLHAVPAPLQFDLVVVGDALDELKDPLAGLAAILPLLEAEGRVIMTAPNLASAQLTEFGPNWSIWHQTYGRHFLSTRSLPKLAAAAAMRVSALWTYSTIVDAWLSEQVDVHGMGVNVPLGQRAAPPDARTAAARAGLARLIHDPFGRGDRLCAVMTRDGAR